jgi:hypothetical protein
MASQDLSFFYGTDKPSLTLPLILFVALGKVWLEDCAFKCKHTSINTCRITSSYSSKYAIKKRSAAARGLPKACPIAEDEAAVTEQDHTPDTGDDWNGTGSNAAAASNDSNNATSDAVAPKVPEDAATDNSNGSASNAAPNVSEDAATDTSNGSASNAAATTWDNAPSNDIVHAVIPDASEVVATAGNGLNPASDTTPDAMPAIEKDKSVETRVTEYTW